MKVYISADIEGITGLVSWSQCSRPDGKSWDFPFARRMMTHDVNAAVRGVRAAGATEVVIKDSHGNSKNMLLDELEPGVQLISGHGSGSDGMVMGIDDSFDACLLVGYHGMAGTLEGIMEHTITGGVHRMWVNGILTGEMGLSAGTAGRFGVPIVMVSSDTAGCAEAAELVPGVVTTATKIGYGRYMGQLFHPSETGPAIEKAAMEGVQKRASIQPTVYTEPTHIKVEFNRSEMADQCMRMIQVSRVDACTVEGTFDSYAEAHKTVWSLMTMSNAGLDSQW